LHGTSAEGARGIINDNAGRAGKPLIPDQWNNLDVAMVHPQRLELGNSQYLSDLGTAAETAIGYSDKWALIEGKQPGPVLVFDASHQPDAWSNAVAHNGGQVGTLPRSLGMKGSFNPGHTSSDLIGTIPPGSTSQFDSLYGALNQEHHNSAQSGTLSPDKSADLNSRADIVNELKHLYQAQLVLDVVAPDQTTGTSPTGSTGQDSAGWLARAGNYMRNFIGVR
jgi:hypothetical protein